MGKFKQVHTAVAASLGSLLTGVLFVWPSYTLSIFKAKNVTVLSTPMSDFEAAMLSSFPSLGAMLGTTIAGSIIDRFGRKKGGLLLTVPMAISWTMIGVSTSTIPILIARFVGGISGGGFMVFSPIFISEIVEDSIRGALTSVPILFYCSGTLISYLMGWFLTYKIIIWTNVAMAVVCMLMLMTATESPLYFMRQNKEDEAKTAIATYRGVSNDSKEVLEEIFRLRQQVLPAVELISVTDPDSKETEKEKLNAENCDDEDPEKMSPFKLLFSSLSSRQGFIVVGTALGIQVIMGIVPVQVYAKDLFTAAVPEMSSHVCSALLSVVMVVGSCAPAVLADKAGRRFLIITSSIMVGVCMLALGVLLQTNAGPAWLSVTLMLAYCFFFCFGAGTIPYVLLAEMFIPEVQSIASMLLVEWVWLLNFLILGIFPYFIKYFGFHGMCYVFAVASVANACTSYFLVPETKGLSNQQVQLALLKRKK